MSESAPGQQKKKTKKQKRTVFTGFDDNSDTTTKLRSDIDFDDIGSEE